ncbi:MAG: 4-carboxymuconolactone decarboxylase, partial [Pseudolysinimonas sp.]
QLSKLVDVDDESYALDVDALAAFDRSADLGQLRVPAVFVSGEFDLVTTPEQMSQLADQVAGSRSVELAGVSHLSVIEAPDAAAHEIARLLADSAQGMRTRRAVLGDAHVDRATAAATAETQPFQDFITRYAWGEIWSRTELSRRDRSIATLAVLVADSHESELRMHIRAALRNGLTRSEIAEVIMHTALYAGLPPANSALAVMREVFENLEADETDQPDQPVQTEQEGSR